MNTVIAIAAASWAAGVASAFAALDACRVLRHTGAAGFNQPHGNSSPLHTGEYAADASQRSGFFTFAQRHTCAFSMAGSGGEASQPAGSVCRSATPPFARLPRRIAAVWDAFRPYRKGNTMTTIRKAFTRPLYVQALRTFPTLEAASSHIDLLLRGNHSASYNIQQTPKGWIVGRVAA